MKPDQAVRLFGLNNLAIEADIRRLQVELETDLGHGDGPAKGSVEKDFYPQFSQRLRRESESMAAHYSIFYCLENFIRDLIRQRMVAAHGDDWWLEEGVIPEGVRKNCDDNKKREKSAGITPRSEDMLDYSNFGELGDILRANWDFFGETFRDKGAVNRILSSLNTLRAPIAHCKSLAEDEVVRLHLALRDWFRQMS